MTHLHATVQDRLSSTSLQFLSSIVTPILTRKPFSCALPYLPKLLRRALSLTVASLCLVQSLSLSDDREGKTTPSVTRLESGVIQDPMPKVQQGGIYLALKHGFKVFIFLVLI